MGTVGKMLQIVALLRHKMVAFAAQKTPKVNVDCAGALISLPLWENKKLEPGTSNAAATPIPGVRQGQGGDGA